MAPLPMIDAESPNFFCWALALVPGLKPFYFKFINPQAEAWGYLFHSEILCQSWMRKGIAFIIDYSMRAYSTCHLLLILHHKFFLKMTALIKRS